MQMPKPTTVLHEGVHVVRDDLLPGGTKARYLIHLFERHDHIVYASPAEGGAQTALAWAARETGKRCTIFTARRREPHPRTLAAKRLGALVVLVEVGHLNVVQSRARTYCQRTGAYELPFGAAGDDAEERIAEAARAATDDAGRPLTEFIGEVWCAGGSGTLVRGLGRAFTRSRFVTVEVGRALKPMGLGLPQRIVPAGLPFGKPSAAACPFPSDPHYDRKVWAIMMREFAEYRGEDDVLFWNVTGPAEDIA